MPWPWKIARDCLDLSSGQVAQYPLPGGYLENEFVIDAMRMVWRVWKLFNTPMSRTEGNNLITNYTGADMELYDWLNKNAWND